MPDPELIATVQLGEPLVQANIQLAADGDPAGVIPGGSGTTATGQFSAPGWLPNGQGVEWTAAAYGEIVPKACSITEAGGGSGNGGGGA